LAFAVARKGMVKAFVMVVSYRILEVRISKI